MQQIAPSGWDRVALHAVQLGAVAAVLVSLPFKTFDLDRFFVPKEFVLHATATIATIACIASRRRVSFHRLDFLLVLFLALSAASTVFATNWWLATRALAITLSGFALFWAARCIRANGQDRALVCAIAVAATLGAATSLVQAYGVEFAYFSMNRAPGGSFGNRNFMAHVSAIALPAILLCALTARHTVGFLLGAGGMGVVAAALVLSRSRAAWLALIGAFSVMLVAAWLKRRLWHGHHVAARAAVASLIVAAGVAAAIWVPNSLDWRSDSPYLDSVRGVVDYQRGSGRGRLVQYENTLDMTVAHPLLGVGPGNWPVAYPQYASDNDRSLDSEGMTANPWPSSDWMAFLSERGVPAFAALALVLLVLAFNALRQLRDAQTAEQLVAALALGGTLVATIVVGTFDAVLLLAAPTLVVWTLFGVLAEPRGKSRVVTLGVHQWLPVIVFTIGGLAATRSVFQSIAMGLAHGTTRTGRLEQAALMDPGNYRIRTRLADLYLDRGSCSRVVRHARAARRLFPNAAAPRTYLAACGERIRRES